MKTRRRWWRRLVAYAATEPPMQVAGDALIALVAYLGAWTLRSYSSLGLFEGAFQPGDFARVPHPYWLVAIAQIVALGGLRLYERPPQRVGRTILLIFAGATLQAAALAVALPLVIGVVNVRASLYPVLWLLNLTLLLVWRLGPRWPEVAAWAQRRRMTVPGRIRPVEFVLDRFPWLWSLIDRVRMGRGARAEISSDRDLSLSYVALIERLEGLYAEYRALRERTALLRREVIGVEPSVARRLATEYRAQDQSLRRDIVRAERGLREAHRQALTRWRELRSAAERLAQERDELRLRHRLGEYSEEEYGQREQTRARTHADVERVLAETDQVILTCDAALRQSSLESTFTTVGGALRKVGLRSRLLQANPGIVLAGLALLLIANTAILVASGDAPASERSVLAAYFLLWCAVGANVFVLLFRRRRPAKVAKKRDSPWSEARWLVAAWLGWALVAVAALVVLTVWVR